MLTEIYIKALLVDEELAYQVWDAGEIDDQIAFIAWMIISQVSHAQIRAKLNAKKLEQSTHQFSVSY